MKALPAGLLAAAPGVATVWLAAGQAPPEARVWIGTALVGVTLAIHPRLRGASVLAGAGVVVALAFQSATGALPAVLAVAVGLLLLGYVLALDLADLVGGTSQPVVPLLRGWFDAVTTPAAAGLAGGAVALVAATAPVEPTLLLALAGPAAVVAIVAVALRGWMSRRESGDASE